MVLCKEVDDVRVHCEEVDDGGYIVRRWMMEGTL